MGIVFALAGNQNSGKSTLFNVLTGSKQHVGNWPGVTVEKKEGTLKKHKDISVVDLPGIYSLSPYTSEEIISRDFIVDGGADAVINIVDATNIERNLYLSLQIAELGKPMIIALNMMDEVRAEGDYINPEGLEEALGIPVVPISAKKNEGIDKLIRRAIEVAKSKQAPPIKDICEGFLHESLHSIQSLVESKAIEKGYTPRFAATKLVEGDFLMQDALSLSNDETHIIDEIIELLEKKTHLKSDEVTADARYQFITTLVSEHVKKKRSFGSLSFSNKVDKIVTNKYLAIPLFILVVYLMFWITFGPIGSFVADKFNGLLEGGIGFIAELVVNSNLAEWLQGLIVDGVLAGIGSVLSFLPVILMLFLCLSFLEDSGYMARAAFVMDKFLRKLGLSGKAFIPLIMGFGCSVPALMATRTLESEKDRKLTMMLTPFMSCGAKIPIYALFISAFFTSNKDLIMLAVYLVGIIVAILSGLLLKNTLFRGDMSPFIMELPTYRLPSIRSIVILLWEKIKGFVTRAFTVIFAASVIIWFLQFFTFSLQPAAEPSLSILGVIGSWVAWIFKPLGFGTWQAATAIFTGFLAKEAVVSTLGVIYGVGIEGVESGALGSVLQTSFTPVSAFAFMVFNLLCVPCAAAVAALRREMGSSKEMWRTIIYQTVVAWVVALLIFQIGRLFF